MSTDRNEQNDLSQFYLQFLESKKKRTPIKGWIFFRSSSLNNAQHVHGATPVTRFTITPISNKF